MNFLLVCVICNKAKTWKRQFASVVDLTLAFCRCQVAPSCTVIDHSLLQEILTKPPFLSEINDQIKVIIDSRSLFSMSISFTVCLSLFFQILLGLLVVPEFASSSHKGNIIPFLFYRYIWSLFAFNVWFIETL